MCRCLYVYNRPLRASRARFEVALLLVLVLMVHSCMSGSCLTRVGLAYLSWSEAALLLMCRCLYVVAYVSFLICCC